MTLEKVLQLQVTGAELLMMSNGKQISFLNLADYDHCVYLIFTYFVKNMFNGSI